MLYYFITLKVIYYVTHYITIISNVLTLNTGYTLIIMVGKLAMLL